MEVEITLREFVEKNFLHAKVKRTFRMTNRFANVSARNPRSSTADPPGRSEEPNASPAAERHPRNYVWSELMNRVFAADVLACEQRSACRKRPARFWTRSSPNRCALRFFLLPADSSTGERCSLKT